MFPTIGKAGLGIGGAHGEGRVYEQGKHVGDTKMTQLSIGWQAGAEGYSEIIFFQDKRSFDEFTSGNFEFGANVSAVVITAAASGTATTTGSTATASGGKKDANTAGKYRQGHRDLHHLQGRSHVRSVGLGAEVLVQAGQVAVLPRGKRARYAPACNPNLRI